MTTPIRISALLLSAALAGVTLARPGWLEWLGVEFAPEAQSCSELILAPDSALEDAFKRIMAKRQVIARLRKGELTLFEAAAWFGRLNTHPVEYPYQGWRLLPGKTDEEKLCHQVIHWMESEQTNGAPADEIRQTVAELAAELEARLADSGRIDLPAWR